jgi:hypothetical protein
MGKSTTPKRDYSGRPYRVPHHLAEKAEAEARRRCKKTGEPIRWTDIIREVLEKHLK